MKTRKEILLEAARLIETGGWLRSQRHLALDAAGEPVDLSTGRGVKFTMYGAIWTALAGAPGMRRVEAFLDFLTRRMGPQGTDGFICTSFLYWEGHLARGEEDVLRFLRDAAAVDEPSALSVTAAVDTLQRAGFAAPGIGEGN